MSLLSAKKKNILFVLNRSDRLAQQLCRFLPAESGKLQIRSFPDGETHLRVLSPCRGHHTMILIDFSQPDTKILKLIFLANALRNQGARSVGLIAPYLPYMRQDRAFQRGEVITSQSFAEVLSQHFDWLVTVDPHLHRYHSLADIYSIPTKVVSAMPSIATWIQKHIPKPVLIGPDEESTQWVSQVTATTTMPSIILRKKRKGDRHVIVTGTGLKIWKSHTPVLVDDIISTGHTMIETIRHLRQTGFAPPVCIGVHGLFVEQASAKLFKAGATKIVTSNTLQHSSNAIDLSFALADAARSLSGRVLTKRTAVNISHPNPLRSIDFIRRKLDGYTLSQHEIESIVQDIAHYRYSHIELTAFVVACSKRNLSEKEIVYLTQAMVTTGETIHWDLPEIFDKHCIGGIPGNRTTMIVVPIVAAFGLFIPKTSSRAITSPAGTADTMETITNVELSLTEMKKIVSKENACITWGGALALAPVDDIIISVERPLSLDSEGQMIASILSKKKAAGSTHVLIDIPVGRTSKVTTRSEALRLQNLFERVGKRMGIQAKVILTDGCQPIGNGIGPVLEAMDVLKVLTRDPKAPKDLRDKSLMLAGILIEMSGKIEKGSGLKKAKEILDSGQAFTQFMRIAKKQGPLKRLQFAPYRHIIKSVKQGRIFAIHNKKIAKIAQLTGAPNDPQAGVLLAVKKGTPIKKRQILFEIFAEHKEKLNFAIKYVSENQDIMLIK